MGSRCGGGGDDPRLIYVIRAERGPVKVGVSSNPRVLDNIAGFAEGERTKVIVVRFELLLELMPSILFVIREFPKSLLHLGRATVYAKATLNYLGNAPSRRQERIQICVE
jgi:hypothetical protein